MDRSLAVDRLAQSIDNTPQHVFSYRYFNDCACRFDYIAFADFSVGSENYRSDIVCFQVQSHTVCSIRKLQQFSCHAVFQTVDSGDSVTYLNYRTEVRNIYLIFVVFYLFLNDCTYFFRS